MSKAVSRLTYEPQLDSFRFFAVTLVIIAHWLPGYKINEIPNGTLGVTFFFVLSGFLISYNLICTRDQMDKGKLSFQHAMGTFYIRRTLRIFPLYFLTILLVFALIPTVFEGHLIWYLTYLPNFLIFKTSEWPGMLSHFWSLGVEEQFYLVWPFLIFLVRRDHFKFLFLGIILLSTLFRFGYYLKIGTFFSYYDVLPFSHFGSFGIGALLALFLIDNSRELVFISRMSVWMGVSVSATVTWIVFHFNLPYLSELTISAASFYLILGAVNHYKGLFGFVVNNRIIQYFGKISYGLYVYHNFMPWLYRVLTGRETAYPLAVGYSESKWLRVPSVALAMQFVLLITIASLSWFLIEKPINQMKRYFI